MNKKYEEICLKLRGLTEGERHPVPNMANGAALLWQELSDINWAGFYTMEKDEYLLLGPFQGKPACIRIPMGKGVCGSAAAEKSTQVVKDVSLFPGHIACDSASKSEIVDPIFDKQGNVTGVLDIDSPVKNRFTEIDKEGLEEFVKILEKACDF